VNRYDTREICALFDRGENVIEWINSKEGAVHNSPTSILYSYDAQAGSYTAQLADPGLRALKEDAGKFLAEIITELAPDSLLEAGIGEATSLVPILRHLESRPTHVLGFDLSLSRLLFARRHLTENGNDQTVLFAGALDRIPLESASVDVVLTIHAVEPNHGFEDAILTELLRVARRHLVLVEPSYEFASAQARRRMERLGYVRGIPEALQRLGQPAGRIERFPYNSNALNEAALIIVEKHGTQSQGGPPAFTSPVSGRALFEHRDCWYCRDDGHAFPVIAGIPCLTVEHAILVSKLQQFERP
jgi:ubiquinone/menaquinone biosynthesis C-methylase UbiE